MSFRKHIAVVQLFTAGSFVLLTAFHPFFFFPSFFFFFRDKHWVGIQHGLLRSGLGAAGSCSACWRCSGSLLSKRQGTHGDSVFPTGCTERLKTCLCRVSESRPGWSCHCSLPPFQGCWKEQHQSSSPRSSLFQALPAVRSCLPRATHHLTSAPRSPENEGEPGLPLCPSPCPASERADLPVLEWVPVTGQDPVPFNSKPSHTHGTARWQRILYPAQLKKESSFLIFSRQNQPSVKALERMEKGQEC